MTEKYGAVMILEDDLFVSPDFYNYAMQALERYGMTRGLQEFP